MGSCSFKHSKKSENPFPSLVSAESLASSSSACSSRVVVVIATTFCNFNGLRWKQGKLPPMGQMSNQMGRLCGFNLLPPPYFRGLKNLPSFSPFPYTLLVNKYIPTFSNCLLNFYSVWGDMLRTTVRKITKPDMILLLPNKREILMLRLYCFNLHIANTYKYTTPILTHSRHHH